MSARILDGNALAKRMRADIGARALQLAAAHRAPGLAVILVGDDAASEIYVRNKVKACADAHLRSWMEKLPATIAQDALLGIIAELNANPEVDGILIQLPLPPALDTDLILESVAPEKDVDGLQMRSAGALLTGQPGFRPCTPFGIMKMLAETGIPLAGAEAVVIGRSASVGKPMALMLLEHNATVTICHSKSRDLAAVTRRAQIVVAAVGRARMLRADMVQEGAVVIDVGINRGSDGKLCGDVDFDAVSQKASWISPVPGGVGPMTITMLLENTLASASRTLLRTP